MVSFLARMLIALITAGRLCILSLSVGNYNEFSGKVLWIFTNSLFVDRVSILSANAQLSASLSLSLSLSVCILLCVHLEQDL